MSFPKNKDGRRWKYPDRLDHERHIAWLRSKCQAAYRNEPWTLTMEEYFSIWNSWELWSQRGRKGDSLCLSRIDIDKPWSLENVKLMTRVDQMQHSRNIEVARGLKIKRGRPLGRKTGVR